MATEAQKTDDPYGGFNDFDHAYDLGVSLFWTQRQNSHTFRMCTRTQNLCARWLVQAIADGR